MTTSSLNVKWFPVWVVNICGQILCFFIALPLPVIVRTICLFDNFEKLSMLLGFSRDILEGWARVCCAHVLLVYIGIYPWIPHTQDCHVQSRDWYVVDQTLSYLVPYWSKSVWSRSFFCFMDLSDVEILNTEASKFKTGKRNGFVGACGWFRFWRQS